MERLRLGPNGALRYCMRTLAANLEWLRRRVEQTRTEAYLVVDMPGQLELYTADDAVARIIAAMQRKWDWRICAVHLTYALLICG